MVALTALLPSLLVFLLVRANRSPIQLLAKPACFPYCTSTIQMVQKGIWKRHGQKKTKCEIVYHARRFAEFSLTQPEAECSWVDFLASLWVGDFAGFASSLDFVPPLRCALGMGGFGVVSFVLSRELKPQSCCA
jgi:hypothetical protein